MLGVGRAFFPKFYCCARRDPTPDDRARNNTERSGLFRWVSSHVRWPKYWSFRIHPSNEYSGLISFRIDWFDFLAVQGTLKCFLQHHNSKASVLQCSAFYMVQFSHLYMTTGKTIALTIQTIVGKVMSHFLIHYLDLWWFPSKEQTSFNPSAVILVPKKIKCYTFHFSPFYLPWRDGTGCHDLSFLNVDFQASFFTLVSHLHQEAL